MTTPVLVIAFNRAETLAVLLEVLKSQGAKNVFFAVDGPRPTRQEDEGKVQQVKQLIAETFAPDPAHCLFQTANLGIRKGPPAAISWFFEQVEEGIILEDDCIPGTDFFPFVEWALETYRNEDRVKLISGFNRYSPVEWPESFRFVKTAMIWGWASWRRAWRQFDPDMLTFDDPLVQRRFRRWAGSFPVYDYWRITVNWVRMGKLVTWDVAWCWAVFHAEGLGIQPRVSLIRNIGFGSDSTNTQSGDARAGVVVGQLAAPYRSPARIEPDLPFQRRLDRAEFWRTDDTLLGRARALLKSLKRRLLARQP